MKIFEENGKIRLQLMELTSQTMLFDFTVAKEDFPKLRDHIIEHLLSCKIESDENEEEDWFCPVCGDLMRACTSESGDEYYFCDGCHHTEEF